MQCDVIMPVWNQPVFTKDCIDSITKNTDGVDYRLIVIDNASEAKTREYLEALAAERKAAVTLIRNEQNLGFVKAVNQGIEASTAPLVCLIKNDTLVFRGWLAEMIAVAGAAKDIGLVNPSSNNLGQKPAKGEPLEAVAEHAAKERGQYVELGAAIGFCMLIKREVIEKIGVFDEAYGMGNFEDTDFSRRAVKAGYRCVRACGAYVYHRENTSFGTVRTFNADFERNREIFEFRWGRPRRIAYVLDECDENLRKKLGADSIALAREGNWIWYFKKEPMELPVHSNIIKVDLPPGNFYLAAAFRILKKKKRFSEIFVGDRRFGRALEALAVIHKAKVKYY